MRKLLLLFPIFTIIFGCTKSKQSPLSDSLFPYIEPSSTLITNNFYYDRKELKLYSDSSKTKTFTILDSIQKAKYLTPFIDIDSVYIQQMMYAEFIAKLKTVNGFTPILISLSGDDYDAIHYILINQNEKPVSSFIVQGGHYGGPEEVNDSTFRLDPVSHSFFNENIIITSKVFEYIIPETNYPSYFDSLTFKTVINKNGSFSTTQIDSVRLN